MGLKSKSFSDFNILKLKGQQQLLTFGEYSQKKYGTNNRLKRRKVITYFYKNIFKNVKNKKF